MTTQHSSRVIARYQAYRPAVPKYFYFMPL